MKNMIKLPAIVLGLLLLLTGTTQKVMAQGEDVSLQSFYDELSPYGTWIQDPQYGYVWRPDVEQGDFRPYYTNGRWVMTEYGNTWVSNYDWGWAPFHYGRWVYNRYNEWVWIPDTTWGPAWVSWRSGDGYYGWAPMGPSLSININFNIPDLWWVFIPQRNIYYDSFPRYYSRRNVVIINNTTIINNTYVRNRRTYYTGPRADDIRRATRQDVRVYNVNNTGRPSRTNINGNSVNIYTPRPSRGNSNATAAPRQSIRGEGYTTAREGRNPAQNGSATNRPSRGENQRDDNRTGVTPSTREGRPVYDNNSRPSRTENRENPGSTVQRPERGNPNRETRGQRPQQVQPQQPAERPAQQEQRPEVQRPQRQERPTQQPEQQRPEAQRPQRQEMPQRQERPERAPQQQRTEAPRQQPRQEQPQRQESRPEPQHQQQRPERTQQSPPPSRGNESRGGGERGERGGERGGERSQERQSRGGRG
jgi:hypothetical protein